MRGLGCGINSAVGGLRARCVGASLSGLREELGGRGERMERRSRGGGLARTPIGLKNRMERDCRRGRLAVD